MQDEKERAIEFAQGDDDELVRQLQMVLEDGPEYDRPRLCEMFRRVPRNEEGHRADCSVAEYLLSCILFDGYGKYLDDLMSDR